MPNKAKIFPALKKKQKLGKQTNKQKCKKKQANLSMHVLNKSRNFRGSSGLFDCTILEI